MLLIPFTVSSTSLTTSQSIASLTGLTASLTTSLTHTLSVSQSLLNTQLQTHTAVTQLGDTAREEMTRINETAAGVIEGMMNMDLEREARERDRERYGGAWGEVWKMSVGVLGWLVRWVWRGNYNDPFNLILKTSINCIPPVFSFSRPHVHRSPDPSSPPTHRTDSSDSPLVYLPVRVFVAHGMHVTSASFSFYFRSAIELMKYIRL